MDQACLFIMPDKNDLCNTSWSLIPGMGTEQVLKALRNEGVKATFFVNSQYLHDKDEHKAARNKNLLLAAIV